MCCLRYKSLKSDGSLHANATMPLHGISRPGHRTHMN